MVYSLVLGSLISLLVIPMLLLPALLRSIHERRRADNRFEPGRRAGSAPRLGGVALAVAFLGIVLLICLVHPAAISGEHRQSLHVIWGALAMLIIGTWDEYRRLGPLRKLLLQALTCAGLFSQGIQVEPFSAPVTSSILAEILCNGFITVLWLVSLTNLVQVIDKVIGLASIIGLTALALVGLAGYCAGVEFPALCAMGLVGALAGFSIYHLPPARIRLGNGGACLLGFLIAALTTLAASDGTILAGSVTPFAVVTLLILAAGFAVLRRSLGGASLLARPPKPAARRASFPQRGIKPHAS